MGLGLRVSWKKSHLPAQPVSCKTGVLEAAEQSANVGPLPSFLLGAGWTGCSTPGFLPRRVRGSSSATFPEHPGV